MRIGPSDSTSSHLARLDKASVSKMAKTQWRVDFSSTLWALGVGRDGGGVRGGGGGQKAGGEGRGGGGGGLEQRGGRSATLIHP